MDQSGEPAWSQDLLGELYNILQTFNLVALHSGFRCVHRLKAEGPTLAWVRILFVRRHIEKNVGTVGD